MKLFRCHGCACGFAILSVPGGKVKKGGKGLVCPLCQSTDVTELDPVEAIAGRLAKKALELWNKPPSGE